MRLISRLASFPPPLSASGHDGSQGYDAPAGGPPRGDRYEDSAPRGGYGGSGGGGSYDAAPRSDGGYDAGSRGGGGGSDAPESEKLYVGNLSYQVSALIVK